MENENNTGSFQDNIPEKPVKASGKAKKIIAVIIAVCVVIVAVLPLCFGGYKKTYARLTEDKVTYPYILVHGMGGWGDKAGINKISPYWGTDTGSLSEYLNMTRCSGKRSNCGSVFKRMGQSLRIICSADRHYGGLRRGSHCRA